MNYGNKSAIRQLALDTAKKKRPHCGFTRVSEELFEELDAQIRVWIERKIHLSKGKTIR